MKELKGNMKIMVAGVGGQGIVFLTNIIVEAAMLLKIPVSVSEIHGLSQRGGVVTSGIGLGPNYSGFVGHSRVDFLFGLEAMETQRCIPYLHKNSSVIFGDYRIAPYSVNAQTASYPNVHSFAEYLHKQCGEVAYIDSFPKTIDPGSYNVFLLGKATTMKNFPLDLKTCEKAIRNTVIDSQRENTLSVFKKGVEFEPSVHLV